MQKLSSMQTSVNTNHLPSVWNKLNYRYLSEICPERQLYVVDYGCGRKATQDKVYLNLICQVRNATYFPYDPYWGKEDLNGVALRCLTDYQEADLCVCANVLNVIDSIDAIKDVIKNVTKAANWVFQIYEGNKTGEGKQTKAGCWQHNKRTNQYCWIFNELAVQGFLGPYYIKGNLITNNLEILK